MAEATPTPSLASERPQMGAGRKRPLGESPALDRPQSPAKKYGHLNLAEGRDRWPDDVPQHVVNTLKRSHLWYGPWRLRPGDDVWLNHPAHYNPDAMAPYPDEEGQAFIDAEAKRADEEGPADRVPWPRDAQGNLLPEAQVRDDQR